MKKILSLTLVLVLAISLLAGCKQESPNVENNTDTTNTTKIEKIKIGVSPEPHAKLVELVVDDLKKKV